MKLLTTSIMCAGVADRWKRQYFECGKWLKIRTISTEAIYQ